MSNTLSTEGAVPHTVYDCSLPVNERVANALHFSSARAAADYLGMPQNKINHYTSVDAIKKKRRYKSKRHHNKEFAIRITKTSNTNKAND